MHFSLVKVNRKQDSTSNAFDDAIFPLYFGLKSLGFQVEILFSKINPNSQNIIFGSCRSPLKIARLLPSNSIIFNLEQMFDGSVWVNDNYLKQLSEFEVWDYSSANVAFLQSKNISATYVPLGYVPEMSRIKKAKSPKMDILFYGWLFDRRKKIINELNTAAIQTTASNSVFGNSRDNFLASTKAVINIHTHLPARLEVIRLGYVWANKIPIISERSNKTEVPSHLEEACIYASYENLVEEAKRAIYDEKRLQQQAEIGFKAFSSEKMSETLDKMLGHRNYTMTLPLQITPSKRIGILISSFKKSLVRRALRAIRVLRGQEINSFNKRYPVTELHENISSLEREKISQYTNPAFEWHIKEDMTP